MGLKDTWTDKLDGIDDVLAEDINSIANAVIEQEEETKEIKKDLENIQIPNMELAQNLTGDDTDKAPSVKAVNAGLEGKLDKITTKYSLYGTDANGDPKAYSFGNSPSGGKIAQFSSKSTTVAEGGGYLSTSYPEQNAHCANKRYVDGMHLSLSMDDAFDLTVSLLNANNEVIGEDTIELPLEEMIVSGKVSDDGEKIILTLKNGETIEFGVATLVDGFATKEEVEGKVEKRVVTGSTSWAYVTKAGSGGDGLIEIGNRNKEWTLAQFVTSSYGATDNGGHLLTTIPVNPYHCANKKYVDDLIAPILAEVGGQIKMESRTGDKYGGWLVPMGALPHFYLATTQFEYDVNIETGEMASADFTELRFYDAGGALLGTERAKPYTFYEMPSGTVQIHHDGIDLNDSGELEPPQDITGNMYMPPLSFQVKVGA